MKWTRHAITLTIAAASAVWLHAQKPATTDPQQPTFRSAANLVHVDVYPRRDGHVIEDLKAEDFHVLEDGKPQAIEVFQFVKVQPREFDAERRDPNTAQEGNELAADPANRVFVIFLDTYHVDVVGSHETRRPLVDMLDRMLAPNDLFAVATPRTLWRDITFGRELVTLENELTKNWIWGTEASIKPNPEDQDLVQCGLGGLAPRRHEEVVLTKLGDLITFLGNVRQERKALVIFTGGWQLFRPDPRLAEVGRKEAPPPMAPGVYVGPGGKITVDNDAAMGSASACRAIRNHLAAIDDDLVFRNLLQQARRANVVFYPVDPGGLRAPIGLTALNAVEHREDVLRTLANETDGVAVVGTNDLQGGIRRVIDEQAAFYVLGYYSTNPAHDGGYRRIQVQMTHPGVQVTARRGYTAPTKVEMAALRAPVAPADSGAVEVATALGALARLRPSADVFTYASSPIRNALVIEVELASRVAAMPAWTHGADVQAVIVGSSGETAGQVRVRIDAGARGAIMRVPLATTVAGPWSIRVRFKGDATAAPIDDVLEVSASAGDADALVGAPVIYRAAIGPQHPLRPAADFQFRRTEQIHIEWPLVASLDQRIVRLLDRGGHPLPVDIVVTETTIDGRATLVGDLPLTSIAPGDYVIELTATSGGKSVRKLLAIRVQG